MERKLHFRENWLIFLGIWGGGGKLNSFKGFGEQRKNTFRELKNFLSGIRGDQCIISGFKGAQTPRGLIKIEIAC